jgi:hypothetical protein
MSANSVDLDPIHIPTIDHSAGRVTLIEGDIFYSPNCPDRAPPPEPGFTQSYMFGDTSARLHNFTKPRWWTQPYGWLAFLPLRPSFSGEPFDRLNIVPIIVRTPSGYSLHEDLKQSWRRLENKLIWATALIGRTYSVASVRPPPPSVLGYVHTYKSHRAARAQAFASRDWFVLWMGLLSYKIASVPPRPLTDVPQWMELLANGYGFPQSWLNGILASTVATFSSHIRRVGVFMDPLYEPYKYGPPLPPVHWFCDHHVPVWYIWTSKHADEARRKPRLAPLVPPQELLQAATTFLHSTPTPAVDLRPSTPRPEIAPEPQNDPPEWKQFFELRA